MAVTNVGGSAANGVASGSASVTIAKPTGVASGDFLIAAIVSNNNAVTATGWTAHIEQAASTGNAFRYTLLYRVADGSEGSDFTFSKASDTTSPIAGLVVAYRGVDTAAPFSGSAVAAQGAASEPVAGPTATATGGEGMGLALRAVRIQDSVTPANAAVLTSFSDTDADTLYRAHIRIFSGGTVQYACGLFEYGTQIATGASISPSISRSEAANESDNILTSLVLKAYVPPLNVNAVKADATGTAYQTVQHYSGQSAAYGSAYNATMLPGQAAENVPQASAQGVAYDPMGWVIHPVDWGAIAFDAAVATTTLAGHAEATVGLSQAHGYFGAPPSRIYRIASENRAYQIAAENRLWAIPEEDRTYRVEGE